MVITVKYRLVVSVHNFFFCTAVAQAHGVAVKKGVKFVVRRKVHVCL